MWKLAEDWYCSIITTGAGSWTSRQRLRKICSSSCRCSPGDAFHPAFCGTEHHLWDSPTLTKDIPAVREKDQYQVRSNYLFAYLVLLQAVVTVYCKFKLWASVSVTAELSSNISRKRVLYMLLSHHCADRYWRLILEHWLVFFWFLPFKKPVITPGMLAVRSGSGTMEWGVWGLSFSQTAKVGLPVEWTHRQSHTSSLWKYERYQNNKLSSSKTQNVWLCMGACDDKPCGHF